MSVCILQNIEKCRVLWTDFSASCREINRFSVSKIGPEPAKTDDFSSPVQQVILIEGHPRNIPVKLFQNPFIGLREEN